MSICMACQLDYQKSKRCGRQLEKLGRRLPRGIRRRSCFGLVSATAARLELSETPSVSLSVTKVVVTVKVDWFPAAPRI